MSSSSYHDANKREYIDRAESDESVIADILAVKNDPEMEDPNGIGYRPMTVYVNGLRAERNEAPINNKRVLRVMRENSLLSTSYNKKTRKYNSYAGEGSKKYKNHINQRFQTDRPFQKIGTDIFEARWGNKTDKEKIFVSVFEDFFSGEILSVSKSLHPNTGLVIESLEPVLDLVNKVPYLTTIHSDQGIQYQGSIYQGILRKSHVRQSMSRKATPHDNAPTESVIHQIKVGTVLNHDYATREELETAIDRWLWFYNMKRIRAKNNWLTPHAMRINYEQKIA